MEYLGKPRMEGDPRRGTGFVSRNGVGHTDGERLVGLPSDHPVGDVFPRAAGEAISIEDG
jgi:hypothetical protein